MTPKEALEDMHADVIDLRDITENASYSSDEDYQFVKQALTELEELKKRDTPMKVNVNEILTKGKEHKRYSCPSCDYFFGYICTTTTECNILRDNFCHHCGQRLDWNNETSGQYGSESLAKFFAEGERELEELK